MCKFKVSKIVETFHNFLSNTSRYSSLGTKLDHIFLRETFFPVFTMNRYLTLKLTDLKFSTLKNEYSILINLHAKTFPEPQIVLVIYIF